LGKKSRGERLLNEHREELAAAVAKVPERKIVSTDLEPEAWAFNLWLHDGMLQIQQHDAEFGNEVSSRGGELARRKRAEMEALFPADAK
jgi:hypothetical protein